MKKLIMILSALTALLTLSGLAYYFFKLNPQCCPCYKRQDDELEAEQA